MSYMIRPTAASPVPTALRHIEISCSLAAAVRKRQRKSGAKRENLWNSARSLAEQFREREGHYPSRILADKIYRNRENLQFCKERGIRLSGPALGRPRKDEIRDKTQNFLDECERVEVERRLSLAKRKCGLGLITTKLR